MKNLSILLTSLLLVSCGDSPSAPPATARQTEIIVVQRNVSSTCGKSFSVEALDAIIGPSPVDVKAVTAKICAG